MRRRQLLLLAAGAAAVVLVCLRPFGGDSGAQPTPAPPAGPPVAAPPAVPPPAAGASPTGSPVPDDHAHEEHVDGVATGAESLDPDAVPDAVRAAEQFAVAWSTPDPRWPDGLAGLATPALASALAQSPTGPDAGEVTGDGFVLLDAPEWAQIGVTTERGTVILDVTLVDGRWLVSALAWSPEPSPGPPS